MLFAPCGHQFQQAARWNERQFDLAQRIHRSWCVMRKQLAEANPRTVSIVCEDSSMKRVGQVLGHFLAITAMSFLDQALAD
jgi:hypothetical protein